MSENNIKVDIKNTVNESNTDLAPDDVVDAIIEASVKNVKKVETSSNRVVNNTKKQVHFLVDVESKAVVESLVDLENFSISNIATLLPKLIKHVENYKSFTGKQKKSLIIRMIKHIIDVNDGPGDDDFWDPIIKDLVPGMIDTLLDVNDRKLKLRKKPLKMLGFLCCSKPEIDA